MSVTGQDPPISSIKSISLSDFVANVTFCVLVLGFSIRLISAVLMMLSLEVVVVGLRISPESGWE